MNPPPVDIRELLDIPDVELHGNLDPTTRFRWLERNSREIKPGDLFIAVRGENFDGHRFVPDALAAGATAALVSRRWFEEQDQPSYPLLVGNDPVTILQEVARRRRARADYEVIGITGSLGKTSTKEAIAAGLASTLRTFRSPGNMNSEIGLPLSLLEIQPDTQIAVMEMGGAYAFGELALLASIALPKIGVVTNVHPIHLERMGTIEAIAETKTELVRALPADGFALLNGDDHRVNAMASATDASVVRFGRDMSNDLYADQVRTMGQDGVSFTLHGPFATQEVQVPIIGEQAVELTLAAVATGMVLDLPVDVVIDSLQTHHQQVRLMPKPGPNGSTILDDTYNASEPSVRIALKVLEETPAARRIAVLGDMRELGTESEVQHVRVGERAAEVVDILITYGELARTIAESARETARESDRDMFIESFDLDNTSALTEHLQEMLRQGDVALLKGSRGLEMESIVRELTVEPQTATSS